MEPPRVYVETTIPSAYFDTRTAPEMIRRSEATRRWWADAGERYRLVTSVAVIQELRRGPTDRTSAWIELISHLPLLEERPPVSAIADIYIQRKVMPAPLLGDPLHLALASFYRCDYLLTWNYKHLANPNKFEHIRRINSRLRLFVPRIVTPFDLLGDER